MGRCKEKHWKEKEVSNKNEEQCHFKKEQNNYSEAECFSCHVERNV